MDAAVAACAVQCVVEPGSTGIGGDCFMLMSRRGGGDIIAYNGSGRAPAAASVDWYQARGITAIERHTPHSVTVVRCVFEGERLRYLEHGSELVLDVVRGLVEPSLVRF